MKTTRDSKGRFTSKLKEKINISAEKVGEKLKPIISDKDRDSAKKYLTKYLESFKGTEVSGAALLTFIEMAAGKASRSHVKGHEERYDALITHLITAVDMNISQFGVTNTDMDVIHSMTGRVTLDKIPSDPVVNTLASHEKRYSWDEKGNPSLIPRVNVEQLSISPIFDLVGEHEIEDAPSFSEDTIERDESDWNTMDMVFAPSRLFTDKGANIYTAPRFTENPVLVELDGKLIQIPIEKIKVINAGLDQYYAKVEADRKMSRDADLIEADLIDEPKKSENVGPIRKAILEFHSSEPKKSSDEKISSPSFIEEAKNAIYKHRAETAIKTAEKHKNDVSNLINHIATFSYTLAREIEIVRDYMNLVEERRAFENDY